MYLLGGETVEDTDDGEVRDSVAISGLEGVGVLDGTLGVEGGENESLNVLRSCHG